MSQSTRTLMFAGAAAVSVAAAAGLHLANRPASLSEYSDEGREFFPEFLDPNDATSLRVAAFNDETAQVDVFNVDFKNGDWRIPSHHDYPADGEDRLAKTATSVIGIRRGALVSTMKDDHKRLGVLDPLDETVTGTEGRGDRITLAAGENTLADFIVGSPVEDQENVYHVRAADEDRTYRAELNIDISTKFADWIEPDLLDITRGDLREIEIDQYRIDESRGTLVPGDLSELTRKSDTDPWTLNGLNPETEEVKTSTVNQIIGALDDLRIVGVRPKPPGLSADLRSSGSIQMDALAFLDLQSRGFFIDARGALVSNEGEVRVGTADGVLYTLRFGEVFTGTDVELEIGKTGKNDAVAQPAGDKPADTDSGEETAAEDGEPADDELAKSRYVFITANFDESLLNSPGTEPQKPTPPAAGDSGTSEAPKDGKEESGRAVKESPDEATENGDPSSAAPAAEADKSADADSAGADAKPDADDEYKRALEQYERELADFQQRQQAFEESLKQGKERAEELNSRFADWYYVISAESFDKIRVGRAELVEAKQPDDSAGTESPMTPLETAPAVGAPVIEASDPAGTSEMKSDSEQPGSDGEAPAAAKPESSQKNGAEPPSEAPATEKGAESPGDEGNAPPTEKPPADSSDEDARSGGTGEAGGTSDDGTR